MPSSSCFTDFTNNRRNQKEEAVKWGKNSIKKKDIVQTNNHKKQLEKYLEKCLTETVPFENLKTVTAKRYLRTMINYLQYLISKNEESMSGVTIIEFLTQNITTMAYKAIRFLIQGAKILIGAHERGQLNILRMLVYKKECKNEQSEFVIRYLCDLAKSQKLKLLLALLTLNKLQINYEELFQITYEDVVSDQIQLNTTIDRAQATVPLDNCGELQGFCQILLSRKKNLLEKKFILEAFQRGE